MLVSCAHGCSQWQDVSYMQAQTDSGYTGAPPVACAQTAASMPAASAGTWQAKAGQARQSGAVGACSICSSGAAKAPAAHPSGAAGTHNTPKQHSTGALRCAGHFKGAARSASWGRTCSRTWPASDHCVALVHLLHIPVYLWRTCPRTMLAGVRSLCTMFFWLWM